MAEVVRPHRYRHRTRRLCLRHPRGTTRHEGRRASKSAPPMAAPASISAAFPPRRCCMPPSSLPRPAIPSPRWASTSARRRSIYEDDGFKQEAIDGNTKGIDFLFKKNKITVFRGTGRICGRARSRSTGKAATSRRRSQKHRHRHRLRCREASRASRSTRSGSSPRPAPSSSQRCRRSSWSSAPA